MIDDLPNHGPKVAVATGTAPSQSRGHSQDAGPSQPAGHVIADRRQPRPSRADTLHTGRARTRGLPHRGRCGACASACAVNICTPTGKSTIIIKNNATT